MSSLAGWWGGHVNKPEILQRMAEVMSGPDPVVENYQADGFAVTTTRPAVAVGGSHVAASADGNTVVAFAGLLSSEDPKQQCNPAEHCLQLYEDLGIEFARELNGSFAIAICDGRAAQLLLVADRLSTRALYYSCQKDFVFASEVKAILQYPGISRKLNEDRLREFLALGCVLGLDTYYDHIKQVPSASVLIWDGVEPQFVKYWEPRFSWTTDCDIREQAFRAVDALRGAVRRACIGGERPGLMLSGGLDSRAIAATSDRRLLCMTMHQQECYEVATAGKVATALDSEHVFVRLPKTFPLELLKDGSLIGDGMYIYANAQSLMLRNLLGTRGIDRLLNGMMLDVYFSGLCLPARTVTLGRRQLPLPLLVSPKNLNVCDHFIKAHQTGTADTLDVMFGPGATSEVIELIEARVANVISQHEETVQSEYDAVDWLEALGNAVRQADYLHVLAIDRLVPAAIPAHDNEVIDAFLSTPPHYRFNQRVYARFWQLLSKDLRAIPYSSIGGPISTSVWWNWARTWNRKARRETSHSLRRLLHLAETRSGWGAWPDVGQAMRNCEEWHGTLRERASDSYLAAAGMVRGDGLRTLIEQHLEGKFDHTRLLGSWLTLEEWLRHYG